jgi:hypothetical protein
MSVLPKFECSLENIKLTYESVKSKMTHFAFVSKGQNQCDYKWNLTLIDKCKMYHFECHELIWASNSST